MNLILIVTVLAATISLTLAEQKVRGVPPESKFFCCPKTPKNSPFN